MNISTMHTGIDLGLQKLNSSVFGDVQDEEKDYVLNKVIKSFVLTVLGKRKENESRVVDLDTISKYYSALQPYISSVELNKVETLGERFVTGLFPSGQTIAAFGSGTIQAGIEYKVITTGTDFSNYGGTASLVTNDTFVCEIANLVSGSSTVVGETYKIVNADTASFTSAGAKNNNPGTEFTATAIVALGTGTELQVLKGIPPWAGSTSLIPITDDKYFEYISSESNVDIGNYITSGELTAGKKYRVSVVGTTVLTSYGAFAAGLSDDGENGLIFTCILTGTPSWLGGTKLIETKNVSNRLILPQDIDNVLNHAYGTVKSSPYVILSGNKIKVYHDNKFKINRIYLNYIRKPIDVNLDKEIDCDMSESLHDIVVDLAVQHIAGVTGQPTYQGILNENVDANQLKRS